MVGLPTGHRDTLSFFSFPPNPFQESSLKTFLGGLEGLSAWLTWPLEVCSVLVSPSPQMHADMMRTYRLKLIWLLAAHVCILIDSHATRSMHTGLFVHLSLFFSTQNTHYLNISMSWPRRNNEFYSAVFRLHTVLPIDKQLSLARENSQEKPQ